MPLTLRQLEERTDGCIKKIQEFKDSADGIGGTKLGKLQFNSSGFFTGVVDMRKEDIDAFLSLFPQLPRVLEIARQAANEEIIRRKFEVDIEKVRKEKEVKMKRFYEAQQKKRSKEKQTSSAVGSCSCFRGRFVTRNGSNKLTLELFFVLPLTNIISL